MRKTKERICGYSSIEIVVEKSKKKKKKKRKKEKEKKASTSFATEIKSRNLKDVESEKKVVEKGGRKKTNEKKKMEVGLENTEGEKEGNKERMKEGRKEGRKDATRKDKKWYNPCANLIQKNDKRE